MLQAVNGGTGEGNVDVCQDEQYEERLQKYEELKNAAERRWKEAGIGDGHLEEQRVEEAVTDIDERVLVEVAHAPVVPCWGSCSHIIVHRVVVVVVGLIFRHLGGSTSLKRSQRPSIKCPACIYSKLILGTDKVYSGKRRHSKIGYKK